MENLSDDIKADFLNGANGAVVSLETSGSQSQRFVEKLEFYSVLLCSWFIIVGAFTVGSHYHGQNCHGVNAVHQRHRDHFPYQVPHNFRHHQLRILIELWGLQVSPPPGVGMRSPKPDKFPSRQCTYSTCPWSSSSTLLEISGASLCCHCRFKRPWVFDIYLIIAITLPVGNRGQLCSNWWTL